MGFIMDGLDAESYDRKYSDKELLKRIIQYLKRHKKALVLISISLILTSLAGSAAPILISKAVDIVSGNKNLPLFAIFAGALILVGSLGWVFNYIRQRFEAKVVGEVVLSLRSDVFKKTISHDLSFYDENPSGKIVSRITSDTRDFSEVVKLITDFFSQFLLVFLIIIWLFTINAVLASIMIVMIPVAVVIAVSFRKIARKVTTQAKRATANINAQIQEASELR